MRGRKLARWECRHLCSELRLGLHLGRDDADLHVGHAVANILLVPPALHNQHRDKCGDVQQRPHPAQCNLRSNVQPGLHNLELDIPRVHGWYISANFFHVQSGHHLPHEQCRVALADMRVR